MHANDKYEEYERRNRVRDPLETPIEWLMRSDMRREPPPPRPPKKPKLRCLADLPEQPPLWLWPGRIPRGAVTLLCGDAGRGKSLLSLDIAARVTTGQPWPDGSQSDKPGDVLLLSAEDSIGRTVRSRLLAQDADLRRVFYLNSGVWLDPTEPLETSPYKHTVIAGTPFGDLPAGSLRALHNDAYDIKGALGELPDCQLVVIDPMPAYLQLEGIESLEHARAALAPLASFADRTGAAVIAVVHRDQAMLRPNDKRHYPLRALADLARAIYLIDRHPGAPGSHAMLPVKNNLGDARSAPTFTVTSAPGDVARIEWSQVPLDLTGDELVTDPRSTQSRAARPLEIDRAVAWLEGALAAGPVPSRELAERALQAGFNDRMLDRARARLGVQAYKEPKFEGRWACALPPHMSRDRQGRQEIDEGRQGISLSSLSSLSSFEQPANH